MGRRDYSGRRAERQQSGTPRSGEDACRKHDDGADELENSRDRNSQQAEGNQEQPDNRVEHQRQQGQRPAEDKQNAPEQKIEHRNFSHLLYLIIRAAPEKVPSLRDV